jgi:uncharacterized membrane protein YuzA (DUF378 family)
MEMLKRFEPVALLFLFLGALNWGILGLFEENVLAEIFGTGTLTDIVYVVIGAAALVMVPRLLDEFHIGHDHGVRPHGA